MRITYIPDILVNHVAWCVVHADAAVCVQRQVVLNQMHAYSWHRSQHILSWSMNHAWLLILLSLERSRFGVDASRSLVAGVLYPLQRAFLYTFKPELVPYDHIESVEFERQQSGLHASNVKTFDLAIAIRPDAATRTKNFLFRCATMPDVC